MKNKLEAVEMWFLRRMFKISWIEEKSNKGVIEIASTERIIAAYNKNLRRKQLAQNGEEWNGKSGNHGKSLKQKARRQRMTYSTDRRKGNNNELELTQTTSSR